MKNIKTTFALLVTLSIGNHLYADDILKSQLIEAKIFQETIPSEVFLNQALLYGLKSTQISGIAAQNATNKKIKTFAQSVLDDYTEANTALLALAKTKNITLAASKAGEGQRPDGRVDSAPTTLQDTSRNQNQGEAGNTGQAKGVVLNGFNMLRDADIQQSISKLKETKGQSFDDAYVVSSIQDHQNMVALFEAGAKSADAEIKKYAQKYLPKFKSHLAQITRIGRVK